MQIISDNMGDKEIIGKSNLDFISRSDMCEFRPALFFQQLQTWHVANCALDFRINLTTGVNEARFITEVWFENIPERLANAKLEATKIVPDADARDDRAAVTKRITDAVAWGDTDQVRMILQTCYVTQACALPALGEAARRGFLDCLTILLNAGVSPSAIVASSASGKKNAFHIACEHGQEECASLLITFMKSMEEVEQSISCTDDGIEITAFELLRGGDMMGMARRLRAQAESQFDIKST